MESALQKALKTSQQQIPPKGKKEDKENLEELITNIDRQIAEMEKISQQLHSQNP